MAVTTDKPASAEAIRPFSFDPSEGELEELRARVVSTRLPERETVADSSKGVQLAMIEALVEYWGSKYDFGRIAARLNAHPQFITEIDGLDIHFIHVKSKHENALPLLLTHGWPGSVVEFLSVIEPLTDPTAYGGKAEDAFDVVIPSIPGYGSSGKPTETGWGVERIADAWFVLMKRLGYDQFLAQGGDWGAVITDIMGVKAPPELLGIHSNMPGILPPEIASRIAPLHVEPAPDGLSADEQATYERLTFIYNAGVSYAVEMAIRPQTLYGIADSPVGLAAWMLDHDMWSYEDIAQGFVDGKPVGNLTRDEVLDNITYTWLTNTGVSSARLYAENTLGFFDAKGVSPSVPVAVSVFPRELYQAPRSWTERAYPNLVYYNEVDRGCHFAAWQEPQLFTEELRAGFASLR
jgi:pimeloyl-ACP methyl ester carboxylesterase